jgi:hypothetical protein
MTLIAIVGRASWPMAASRRCDALDLTHQRAEAFVHQRLLAVADRAPRVVMYLDDQPVGASFGHLRKL